MCFVESIPSVCESGSTLLISQAATANRRFICLISEGNNSKPPNPIDLTKDLFLSSKHDITSYICLIDDRVEATM